MTDPRPPRVTYAFPVSHRFRVPFHHGLRRELTARNIDYSYIYASNAGDHGKDDLEEIGWARDIPQRSVSIAGRRVVFHSVLGAFLRSDLFIVQQENRLLANYLLIVLARLLGRRVAYFGHGRNFQARNPDGPGEKWKRFWATKVHWWFTYTEGTADLIAGYGFPRARITVFNNAIDTGAIAAERARINPARLAALRDTLVGGSKNVGIYVGGLYAEKRIGFLIEAARLIRARVPDFHLIVVGGGPDAQLVEAARAPWIHYAGPRFGTEKTELVALAKVWLMPGLVGLAVLDSFAHETPMVTTAYPYHSPEFAYLEDGVNGLVVPAWEDAGAYARAVADLLADAPRRQELVEGARAAQALYTVENMARLFAGGVEAALAARPR